MNERTQLFAQKIIHCWIKKKDKLTLILFIIITEYTNNQMADRQSLQVVSLYLTDSCIR